MVDFNGKEGVSVGLEELGFDENYWNIGFDG